MYLEAIAHDPLELSKRLHFLDKFNFYLTEGTGLALQLGHRSSINFHFFTKIEFNPDVLASVIRNHGISYVETAKAFGTLHCIMGGVKTSFLFYNEPLLFNIIRFNSLKVADWRDIIVEKIRTISERGQKKDFYDFYIGISKMGIESLCELVWRKFNNRINYFVLLKGLTYFEDADRGREELTYLGTPVNWKEIKEFFINHITDFEKAFTKAKMNNR